MKVGFYGSKGSDVDEFHDDQLIKEFTFAVDNISQLNSLNTGHQGNSNVIADLHQHFNSFYGKFGNWKDKFIDGGLDQELILIYMAGRI